MGKKTIKKENKKETTELSNDDLDKVQGGISAELGAGVKTSAKSAVGGALDTKAKTLVKQNPEGFMPGTDSEHGE